MVRGAHLWLAILFITAVILSQVGGLEDQITKYVYNNNGYGSYSFEFETSLGTYRREEGGIVSANTRGGMIVRGEYGYTDPEGRHYVVKYIADANGFQPQINDDDTRFNDRRIV